MIRRLQDKTQSHLLGFQTRFLAALRTAVNNAGSSITTLGSWWLNLVMLQTWLPPALDRRELCRLENLAFNTIANAAWEHYFAPILRGERRSGAASGLSAIDTWSNALEALTCALFEVDEGDTAHMPFVERATMPARSFLSSQVILHMCLDLDHALFALLVFGSLDILLPFCTSSNDGDGSNVNGGGVVVALGRGIANDKKHSKSETKPRFASAAVSFETEETASAVYRCIPSAGPLTFEMGLALKVATARWSEKPSLCRAAALLRSKKHGIAGRGSGDVDANASLFPMLTSLSSILLLPKDVLDDPAMRREVAPALSPALLREVLVRYVPRGSGPGGTPVTEALLSRLSSSAIAEGMQNQGGVGAGADGSPLVEQAMRACVGRKMLAYRSRSATDLAPGPLSAPNGFRNMESGNDDTQSSVVNTNGEYKKDNGVANGSTHDGDDEHVDEVEKEGGAKEKDLESEDAEKSRQKSIFMMDI